MGGIISSHSLAWLIGESGFHVAWQHSLSELLIWRKQATILQTGRGKEQEPLAKNSRKNMDKRVRKLGGESSLERTGAGANILLYDQILSRKPS